MAVVIIIIIIYCTRNNIILCGTRLRARQTLNGFGLHSRRFAVHTIIMMLDDTLCLFYTDIWSTVASAAVVCYMIIIVVPSQIITINCHCGRLAMIIIIQNIAILVVSRF